MNKKSVGIAIILVVIAIAVALRIRMNALQPQQRVTVGVLMPFTTDFGWWGDEIRDSIKLAQADGYLKNYDFVYQDTKCNTKDAVSGTQALKAQYPNMHLFIVGCDNDLKAMVPLLDKNADLAFIPGLSGADLYATQFPIINLAYRLESEAPAAAQFAVNKLHATSS